MNLSNRKTLETSFLGTIRTGLVLGRIVSGAEDADLAGSLLDLLRIELADFGFCISTTHLHGFQDGFFFSI